MSIRPNLLHPIKKGYIFSNVFISFHFISKSFLVHSGEYWKFKMATASLVRYNHNHIMSLITVYRNGHIAIRVCWLCNNPLHITALNGPHCQQGRQENEGSFLTKLTDLFAQHPSLTSKLRPE